MRSKSARMWPPGFASPAATSEPGLMVGAVGRQRVRQPGDRRRRVADDRGARRGGDEGAVDVVVHADEAQVDGRRRRAGAPEDEAPAGGVVGDRVAELDLPVLDATVDYLQRRDEVLRRGDDLLGRDAGPLQGRLQLEGDPRPGAGAG